MESETKTAQPATHVGSLAVWTLAWLLTLAVASFGEDLWQSERLGSWIAIGVNLAAGAGWLVAHARYLRGVDDLQRKILMDAIALALGVGLVGGMAYGVANGLGLVDFGASTAVFAVIMGIVYLVATAAGTLRYR